MQTLYKKTFQKATTLLQYFSQVFLLEMKNKGQVYIFYTMDQDEAHSIGMIEVLINESKTDSEQLVIEWGELNYPSRTDDADNNNGQINLGGGNTYLLTNFGDKFSYIKGYTLCAYDQVIKESGSTSCISLTGSKQKFLLNPFDNKATECGGSDENLN